MFNIHAVLDDSRPQRPPCPQGVPGVAPREAAALVHSLAPDPRLPPVLSLDGKAPAVADRQRKLCDPADENMGMMEGNKGKLRQKWRKKWE